MDSYATRARENLLRQGRMECLGSQGVRLYVFLFVVCNRAHHNRGLSASPIGRATGEGIEVGSVVAKVVEGPGLGFFPGTRKSLYPKSDLLCYSAWIQCLVSGGQDRVDVLQPSHEILWIPGQFFVSVSAKLELLYFYVGDSF